MESPPRKKAKMSCLPKVPHNACQTIIDPNGDLFLIARWPKIHHFKVSSKILSLASPVFQSIFTDETQGPMNVTIDARCIIDALKIILKIIHFQMEDIPKALSLQYLLEIARFTERYEMHKSLGMFPEIWVNNALERCEKSQYTKDIHNWIYIFFVFENHDRFPEATKILTYEFGPTIEDVMVESLQPVLEAINERRSFNLRAWLDSIDDDYQSYIKSTKCAHAACFAQEFVAGFFTRILKKYHVLRRAQPMDDFLTLEHLSEMFTELSSGLRNCPPCPAGNIHYRAIEMKPQFDEFEPFRLVDFKICRPPTLGPYPGE
ncbi:hypothetical protein EMCG_09637 [[Emmonsia] crescens]|uniref:BTB domain-containing protein n=1 Tax=[Emmonsia] crescens TaxID=73230 RepID=A0A0G2I2J0_9EURO|nr:hypothetical protein EMCG_09637 [Emmonsia crescens UAMH 3008]